jgi:hypothetical protein
LRRGPVTRSVFQTAPNGAWHRARFSRCPGYTVEYTPGPRVAKNKLSFLMFRSRNVPGNGRRRKPARRDHRTTYRTTHRTTHRTTTTARLHGRDRLRRSADDLGTRLRYDGVLREKKSLPWLGAGARFAPVKELNPARTAPVHRGAQQNLRPGQRMIRKTVHLIALRQALHRSRSAANAVRVTRKHKAKVGHEPAMKVARPQVASRANIHVGIEDLLPRLAVNAQQSFPTVGAGVHRLQNMLHRDDIHAVGLQAAEP